MRRKRLVAAVVAAAVALAPVCAGATQQKDKEEEGRDGHSRYELAPMSFLPLVLAGAVQERIVNMYLLFQQVSYVIEMTTGVEVTSQNRLRLGGLLGGLLPRTYTPDDFVKSLEVGTVYYAEDGLLAVAMAGNERLQDHRVIVFNGDYQYDPRALPTLQQIEPAQLQKLQAYSLMTELAQHTLSVMAMNTLASLDPAATGVPGEVEGLTQAQLQTEIPVLRRLIVGKVYRGPENTLLVVIPPAIVLDR